MITLITDRLYNCGNSFACGYGVDKTKSYSFMLGKSFESELISVARPGCCNYTISKQIEYVTDSIGEFDFALIGTTNQDRISYSANENEIKGGITLDRFNYNTHKDELLTDLDFGTTNEIQSETLSNILYANTRTLEGESKERRQALKDYVKYVFDSGIKKDQDIFILLWKLTKLNQKTKNWLCVTNYNEIAEEFPNNTLLINFGELCQKYPDTMGSGHFNEEGHNIVLSKIEEWYETHIERPWYDNQR